MACVCTLSSSYALKAAERKSRKLPCLYHSCTRAIGTGGQADAYRAALDTYVVNIQQKALQLFKAGYTKAIQMQVYDEYTAKIREALGRVAGDKFPPERESRSRERIGDRPPTPDLVTEIAR